MLPGSFRPRFLRKGSEKLRQCDLGEWKRLRPLHDFLLVVKDFSSSSNSVDEVATTRQKVRRCQRPLNAPFLSSLPDKCILATFQELGRNPSYRNASVLARIVHYKYWHDPSFRYDDSVEDKEEWLRTLLRESPNAVDTEAFLFVLRALAVSRRPDAAIRAERWLLRLERNGKEAEVDNGTSAVPNSECYQRVIEAWGNTVGGNPAIPVVRAERWLRKHRNSRSPILRPNTACFNSFLDTCSKGRALKGSKDKDLVRKHAEKAESTLLYMIDQRKAHGEGSTVAPNTDSFNYLIRAWTRCRRSPDVADRAMDALRLLENYEKLVDTSVRPNSKSYVMVMDAISVKAKLKAKRCLGWGKEALLNDPSTNGLEEIKLLNDIIAYINDRAKSVDASLFANCNVYNMLISAWAGIGCIHPNAPLEAEKILQHMVFLKDQGLDYAAPDSISYLSVMRAWENSNKPNRANRVTWWLKTQWKDYEFEGRPSLQPTVNSYNAVIRVWSDLREPEKAEEVLSELLQKSEESGILANSESFSLVIRAWLRVAQKGNRKALSAAVRWLKFLREQEKQDTGLVCPQDLYSGILGAARKCAAANPGVLDLAVETFRILRASGHQKLLPIHYSHLLQVGLLALSRPEDDNVRISFVQQIVRDCAEDGLVSRKLINALANGPVFYDGWTIEESQRMVSEVFPEWPLPPSWIMNVRQGSLTPTRADLRRTMFGISRTRDKPIC